MQGAGDPERGTQTTCVDPQSREADKPPSPGVEDAHTFHGLWPILLTQIHAEAAPDLWNGSLFPRQ